MPFLKIKRVSHLQVSLSDRFITGVSIRVVILKLWLEKQVLIYWILSILCNACMKQESITVKNETPVHHKLSDSTLWTWLPPIWWISKDVVTVYTSKQKLILLLHVTNVKDCKLPTAEFHWLINLQNWNCNSWPTACKLHVLYNP